MRGVYAVGRPELSTYGRWMAAVLACGPGAVLSHESAAELWGIRSGYSSPIEISVPVASEHRCPGIRIHRRTGLGSVEVTFHEGIPVTNVVLTLIDLARDLDPAHLERAVNEADRLDLFLVLCARPSMHTPVGRGLPGCESS